MNDKPRSNITATAALCLVFYATFAQALELAAWQPGMLDIHHISTGRGDATFFVFPDGTTLLFDAGDLDMDAIAGYVPLEAAPARPHDARRAGQWIAAYVEHAMPRQRTPEIDFALITHFHSDHYGAVTARSPQSAHGKYYLTGITDVAESIAIHRIIDRGAPAYDFPVNLADSTKPTGRTMANYLAFVRQRSAAGKMTVEPFAVGSRSQLRQLRDPLDYPEFEVCNVAGNGAVWSSDTGIRQIVDRERLVGDDGRFNENPLSLAIVVRYGEFDYFTGGDLTGLSGFGLPDWFDMETPVASAVGEVDALALNHHGNRDATNAGFLAELSPRVLVQQSWISDQPGGEVVHRMLSQAIYSGDRDVFATFVHDAAKIAIGPWLTRGYTSTNGHVVIRVREGGGSYSVHVLDDTVEGLHVKQTSGPYTSR